MRRRKLTFSETTARLTASLAEPRPETLADLLEDLQAANRDADLSSAILRRAKLRGAILMEASGLRCRIQRDWKEADLAELLTAPRDLEALKAALWFIVQNRETRIRWGCLVHLAQDAGADLDTGGFDPWPALAAALIKALRAESELKKLVAAVTTEIPWKDPRTILGVLQRNDISPILHLAEARFVRSKSDVYAVVVIRLAKHLRQEARKDEP